VESLGEKQKPNYKNISMTSAELIGKKYDLTGKKEIEVNFNFI
jgi:hypothetical protein